MPPDGVMFPTFVSGTTIAEGSAYPAQRPDTDSEQCKKLWSHPTKGVSTMKRESEIFMIITILF